MFGGVPVLGVLGPEEVPGRPDLGDGLDGQGGVVDDYRLQHGCDHVQEVGVDNHLLVGGQEATLQPPGAVQQQVDAAHDGPPEGDHTLVGRLGVHAVRGVDIGRPVRHAIAAGQLPADEAGLPVLGGAECRSARPHVHVGGEAAVDHRGSSPHHLGVSDAGQGLGVLEHQGTGHGHRGHGPSQSERGDDDALVTGRHLLDAVEHHCVVSQRGAGVDHRVERWLHIHGVVVGAPGDAGHLDGIEVALATQAVDKRNLVRQGEHVVGGVQVADRRVEVHGLHRVAGHGVDGVQHLAQLDEVPVVVAIAVPAVSSQAGDERRASHAGEGEDVAAHVEIPGRGGGVHGELGRGGGDQVHDQVRVKPHPVAIHPAADIDQLAPGRLVQEVDTGLGQDSQRGLVDGLQLIVGDAPQRFERQARLGPRWLFGHHVACPGPPAEASSSPLGHWCLPVPRLSPVAGVSSASIEPVPANQRGPLTGPPGRVSDRSQE